MKQIFRKFKIRNFGLPRTRNFRKILGLEHSYSVPYKTKLTVAFYRVDVRRTTHYNDDNS